MDTFMAMFMIEILVVDFAGEAEEKKSSIYCALWVMNSFPSFDPSCS